MSNDIVKQDTAPSMMQMIETAMKSPEFKVEQLPMLLQFQKDLMAEQAKISYNEAMGRLQPRIKQVAKTTKGHNSNFAPHDEIDDMVRPLYVSEGFTVDFTTEEADSGKTRFIGTLSHVQGYSKQFKLTLPPDTGGSKNAIQAVISTNSYAKRELTKMMFNIVVCGDDKDGHFEGTPITAEQVKEITDILTEKDKAAPADKKGSGLAWILKHMGVEKIEDIHPDSYAKALNAAKALGSRK